MSQLDKYKRIAKLGEGTYGIVWKAQNEETNQIEELKRIRLESEEEGVPCTAIREISLLKELDHPNIVRLLEIVHDIDKLTLVFEYCKQDLKQLIDSSNGILRPTQIKSYLYQLLKGVAFCHSKRVLHRDLKPQNLLLSEDGTLKLADFGLARAFSVPVRNFSHEVVTLWYRPPEVLMGHSNYSTPIDIWSVGCIFGEMNTGKPMFPGKNAKDELVRIFKALGTPTPDDYPGIVELPEWNDQLPQYPRPPFAQVVPGLSVEALEILKQFLDYDPAKRPSALLSMQHPYLGNLYTDDPEKMKPPHKSFK